MEIVRPGPGVKIPPPVAVPPPPAPTPPRSTKSRPRPDVDPPNVEPQPPKEDVEPYKEFLGERPIVDGKIGSKGVQPKMKGVSPIDQKSKRVHAESEERGDKLERVKKSKHGGKRAKSDCKRHNEQGSLREQGGKEPVRAGKNKGMQMQRSDAKNKELRRIDNRKMMKKEVPHEDVSGKNDAGGDRKQLPSQENPVSPALRDPNAHASDASARSHDDEVTAGGLHSKTCPRTRVTENPGTVAQTRIPTKIVGQEDITSNKDGCGINSKDGVTKHETPPQLVSTSHPNKTLTKKVRDRDVDGQGPTSTPMKPNVQHAQDTPKSDVDNGGASNFQRHLPEPVERIPTNLQSRQEVEQEKAGDEVIGRANGDIRPPQGGHHTTCDDDKGREREPPQQSFPSDLDQKPQNETEDAENMHDPATTTDQGGAPDEFPDPSVAPHPPASKEDTTMTKAPDLTVSVGTTPEPPISLLATAMPKKDTEPQPEPGDKHPEPRVSPDRYEAIPASAAAKKILEEHGATGLWFTNPTVRRHIFDIVQDVDLVPHLKEVLKAGGDIGSTPAGPCVHKRESDVKDFTAKWEEGKVEGSFMAHNQVPLSDLHLISKSHLGSGDIKLLAPRAKFALKHRDSFLRSDAQVEYRRGEFGTHFQRVVSLWGSVYERNEDDATAMAALPIILSAPHDLNEETQKAQYKHVTRSRQYLLADFHSEGGIFRESKGKSADFVHARAAKLLHFWVWSVLKSLKKARVGIIPTTRSLINPRPGVPLIAALQEFASIHSYDVGVAGHQIYSDGLMSGVTHQDDTGVRFSHAYLAAPEVLSVLHVNQERLRQQSLARGTRGGGFMNEAVGDPVLVPFNERTVVWALGIFLLSYISGCGHTVEPLMTSCFDYTRGQDILLPEHRERSLVTLPEEYQRLKELPNPPKSGIDLINFPDLNTRLDASPALKELLWFMLIIDPARRPNIKMLKTAFEDNMAALITD